jgi:flagellar FliJ protein
MAEYAEVQTELEAANKRKDGLESSFASLTSEYESQAFGGVKPAQMRAAKLYLEELQEKIKAAEAEVRQAQVKAENKRRELTEVHKEIKTLEKLKEKQYREYKTEAEKQEAKIMEDMLAFNVAGNSGGDASFSADIK